MNDYFIESSKTFIARSEIGQHMEGSFKPRFIRQLRNLTIIEGDDAFLDCIMVAVPEPKVLFFVNEYMLVSASLDYFSKTNGFIKFKCV